MANRFLLVLDDGSTFTAPSGCTLVFLTEEGAAAVEEVNDAKVIKPEHIISECDLGDLCEYLPEDFFGDEG